LEVHTFSLSVPIGLFPRRLLMTDSNTAREKTFIELSGMPFRCSMETQDYVIQFPLDTPVPVVLTAIESLTYITCQYWDNFSQQELFRERHEARLMHEQASDQYQKADEDAQHPKAVYRSTSQRLIALENQLHALQSNSGKRTREEVDIRKRIKNVTKAAEKDHAVATVAIEQLKVAEKMRRETGEVRTAANAACRLKCSLPDT